MFLVLLACAVYVWLRMNLPDNYETPDEVISLRVSVRMLNSGDWDTNWALADLPPHFKYDQYNFSSYLVTCKALINVLAIAGYHATTSDEVFVTIRMFSVIFHCLTILLAFIVAWYAIGSLSIGVLSAWLVAVCPLLFQDSMYARPESFSTMLTLLAILLAVRICRHIDWPGSIAFGVVVGFLVACKITFVVLLAVPLMAAVAQPRQSLRPTMKLLHVVVLGLLVGFVCGAPYALPHLSAYSHGLTMLLAQYASEHRPHGLPDGNMLQRLVYCGRYFVAIGAGWMLLLAAVGWIHLLRQKRYEMAAIGGISALVFIYFSCKPVFFERNLSFTIPIFAIMASVAVLAIYDRLSRRPYIQTALVAVLIGLTSVPMGLFVWRIESHVFAGQLETDRQNMRDSLREKYGGPGVTFGCLFSDAEYQKLCYLITSCKSGMIIEIQEANDSYTRQYLDRLVKEFPAMVVGHVPSPLEATGLPPSTLYIYHAVGYFYVVRTPAQ